MRELWAQAKSSYFLVTMFSKMLRQEIFLDREVGKLDFIYFIFSVSFNLVEYQNIPSDSITKPEHIFKTCEIS